MIRTAAFFTVLIFSTLISSILGIIVGLISRKWPLVDCVSRTWSRSLLRPFGVKTTIEGTEHLEPGQNYVFVANHQSWTDVFATVDKIPAKIRMIAKKELFKIPVFGWALWACGNISIDREKREKGVKSIEKAIRHIKKYGFSILLYPEGTRSEDGEMLPFKKGAFVLAIKLKMQIVPVTILGSRAVMPKHSFKMNSGRIHMIINKPVNTENMTYNNRKDLLTDIENTIKNQFNKNNKLYNQPV